MPLNNETKKRFKAIGHSLKPVVMVAGNGLSPNVLAEIQRALDDHELIKVKYVLEDREDRRTLIRETCQATRAELVQTIGKMALLFKQSNDPKLKHSNIREQIG